MLAQDAPIFTNLEIARGWVNDQTLDERFFLVEFRVTPEYKALCDELNIGAIPENYYEFFNPDELNEFLAEYAERENPRAVTIIEQWS